MHSLNPDLTAYGMKSIIGGSVDWDPDLAASLLSGGRVNAYNALMLLKNPSFTLDGKAADQNGSSGGGCFLNTFGR